MNKDFPQFQNDIALWGPSGSGKSWLLRAFARKLIEYNVKDLDFHYDLQDASTGYPALASSLTPEPTRNPEDSVWQFTRKPKEKSFAHQISSHVHRIRVHDDKGLDMTNLVKGGVVNTFRESENLFLLLDPTSVEESTSSAKNLFSTSEYTELVLRLLEVISSSHEKKRLVAVCITKIDTMSVRRDPWELIEIYFGRPMYRLMQQSSSWSDISLQTFAVSSVGFLQPSLGNRIPNFDVGTNSLRDAANWDPYNVEAPFFWIFENVERRRLENNQHYSLFQKFLERDRLKNYIPYPIKRH